MRSLFTGLTVPLLLLGLAAAHKPTERDEENLLGPVRSISSKSTTYSPEEGEKRGLVQQGEIVSYDPAGNETERTVYDDFGLLRGSNVNKRDPGGHLVESILYDPEGKAMERVVYIYSGGKLAETVHHDREGQAGLRIVNSYGEHGRLSDAIYHVGDKVVGKTTYRYDAAGLGSETAFFMPDGSRAVAPIGPCLGAHRVTWSYDGKGRPREVVAYQPSGAIKKSWFYAYNDKGLLAQETVDDDYGRNINSHVYAYDPRGNWIKRTTTMIHKSKADRLSPEEKRDFPGLMEPSEMRMTISRSITYH